MMLKPGCDNCVFGEPSAEPGRVYCECDASEHYEEDMEPTAKCVYYEEG